MKVLHVNIYHQLPDDFTGGVNDALRSLADHRESKGHSDNVGSGANTFNDEQKTMIDNNATMLWPIFLDKTGGGFRTVGAIAIDHNSGGIK